MTEDRQKSPRTSYKATSPRVAEAIILVFHGGEIGIVDEPILSVTAIRDLSKLRDHDPSKAEIRRNVSSIASAMDSGRTVTDKEIGWPVVVIRRVELMLKMAKRTTRTCRPIRIFRTRHGILSGKKDTAKQV